MEIVALPGVLVGRCCRGRWGWLTRARALGCARMVFCSANLAIVLFSPSRSDPAFVMLTRAGLHARRKDARAAAAGYMSGRYTSASTVDPGPSVWIDGRVASPQLLGGNRACGMPAGAADRSSSECPPDVGGRLT